MGGGEGGGHYLATRNSSEVVSAHYAQSLILVNCLLVKLFSFLVITRSHELGFGRNLVEIDPRSLPDLFKQLRDLDNSQKQKTKTEIHFLGGGNMFSSLFDPTVRFQTSGSGYREIWTRRIRI